MNILATNDDGYESEGITLLAAALRDMGHKVLIVAPTSDRSGSSHAMTMSRPLHIKQVAPDAWLCDGTPVDCVVAVASGGIPWQPDAVVSGLNAGANLGTDIIYSGTVGAARQAAIVTLPAVAFSLAGCPEWHFAAGARWAAAHFDALIALATPGVFVNVNMPNIKELPPDFMMGWPAIRRYRERMELVETADDGWKTLKITGFEVDTSTAEDADYRIVATGNVAVSRVYVEPVTDEMVRNKGESQ
jgi:5'-nucleotidase